MFPSRVPTSVAWISVGTLLLGLGILTLFQPRHSVPAPLPASSTSSSMHILASTTQTLAAGQPLGSFTVQSVEPMSDLQTTQIRLNGTLTLSGVLSFSENRFCLVPDDEAALPLPVPSDGYVCFTNPEAFATVGTIGRWRITATIGDVVLRLSPERNSAEAKLVDLATYERIPEEE